MKRRKRDPAKASVYMARYRAKNREALLQRRRERYRASNRRELQLRWAYGLSLEAYARLHAGQDGKCAVCYRHESEIPKQILNVDHDHLTNAVRGLLCFDCNTGLGKFKDDPELLRRATMYLDTHRKGK